MPLDQNHPLEIELSEDKLGHFFFTYRNYFIYGFLAILAVVGGFFFFQEKDQPVNYLKAEIDFQSFLKDPSQLAPMEELLNKQPYFQEKYDGALAQALIKQDQWDKAYNYLRKTKILPSAFEKFSQTSLLIAQKNYLQALEMSHQHANEDIPLLKAHHLLRIAMLQQALNRSQEELKAWETFKTFIAANHQIELKTIFQRGSISLDDYIGHREQVLKK